MALDEQLRQLAGQVAAPSAGDPDSVFRRGVRRRRIRRAASVSGAVAVVAVLGLGAASVLQRPTLPDIANRPTEGTERDGPGPRTEWTVTTGSPVMSVSSEAPFPWTVAVSPAADGRWCASAARGVTQVPSVVGERCYPLRTPEQENDPRGLGSAGTDVVWEAERPPPQGLSWGLAANAIDNVVVEFADGSRQEALLSHSAEVDAKLWAIGYVGKEVYAVEAYADGHHIAGFVVLDRQGR